MQDLVTIARIVKTRGLRGELVADVLTDFPERWNDLENVTGILPTNERLELKIEKFWFQKDRIILKFAGYDSVEAAEALRNVEVCIEETDAADLEADEFFYWQLEGCSVETVEGNRIGNVREIMRTGGTEILVVAGSKKDYLIPFAEAICTDVDVKKKLIRVDPPEGLLDF